MIERRKSLDRRTKELIKEAQRELLKEWLHDQYAIVGKYTIKGVGSAIFAGIVWAIQHYFIIGINPISLTDQFQAHADKIMGR